MTDPRGTSAGPPVDPVGRRRTERGWHGFWCRSGPGVHALAPFGRMLAALARRRHRRHRAGLDRAWRAPVPVIVVGNVTVGGTGKTPFVIALVEWLRQQGWRPGVVSRGHGGRRSREPLLLTGATTAAEAGDEAVLLAWRTEAPVVVAADRPAAVRALLQQDVDIVISDDGLQHYGLARDMEIAMIDGLRGLGNGRCLPAGPLREPVARLDSVDLTVATAPVAASVTGLTPWIMRLIPGGWVPAEPEALSGEAADSTGGGPELPTAAAPLSALPAGPVHAVAAIGNPERFFLTLEGLGIEVVAHAFSDHHVFRPRDLNFRAPWPIVMTEKDMMRCRAHWDAWPKALRTRCIALRVAAEMDVALWSEVERRIAGLRAAAAQT